MSQSEAKGPYVYQPCGIHNKTAWLLGRVYAVTGVSEVTRIEGLTKREAEAVLELLKLSLCSEPSR